MDFAYVWFETGGMHQRFSERDQYRKIVHDMLGRIMRYCGNKPVLLEVGNEPAAWGVHSDAKLRYTEERQLDFIRYITSYVTKRADAAALLWWCFYDYRLYPELERRQPVIGGDFLKGIYTRDRKPKLAAHEIHRMFEAFKDACPRK